MRKREIYLDTLEEFCPDDSEFLGGNEFSILAIQLRLRYWEDENEILPLEVVIDAMPHDFAHRYYANHDADFDALLDELNNEYTQLEYDEDFLKS